MLYLGFNLAAFIIVMLLTMIPFAVSVSPAEPTT